MCVVIYVDDSSQKELEWNIDGIFQMEYWKSGIVFEYLVNIPEYVLFPICKRNFLKVVIFAIWMVFFR